MKEHYSLALLAAAGVAVLVWARRRADRSGVRLVHRTASYLVVSKPAGLSCHKWTGGSAPSGPAQPGPGWQPAPRDDEEPTLVDVLRAWPGVGNAIHLVHRLDRATSGLLLVGRTSAAAAELAAALEGGTKIYACLVRGTTEEAFTVDRPLRQRAAKVAHRTKQKRDALRDERQTQEARTAFVRLAVCCDGHCSLLLALPSTGRYHQLRRHLEGLRHPISGDEEHGPPRLNELLRSEYGLGRLFLHACCLLLSAEGEALAATAPRAATGGRLCFTCRLPPDLRAPLGRMPGGAQALARLEEVLGEVERAGEAGWLAEARRKAASVVRSDTWRAAG